MGAALSPRAVGATWSCVSPSNSGLAASSVGPFLWAASPLEHWALNQFIVRKVHSRWTVTHDGIVLSWWSAAPAAIKAAVQVAANAARAGAAQVVMEDPSGCQTVLWDSAKDAFTEV